MYSEVNELIEQLEYCILVKKEKAAKEIVRSLARFKANLKFEVEILYECSSHYSRFDQHFKTTDSSKMQRFECRHLICNECLKDYIQKTYEISKADFPFYCPGCLATSSNKLFKLDTNASYFKNYIDASEFNRSLDDLKILNQNRLILLKNGSNARCTLDEESEIIHKDIQYIPSCFHIFCINCLKGHFLNAAISNVNFTCPYKGCEIEVDHEFIASFFGQKSEAEFYLLTKLKLKNHIFTKCPKCQKKLKIEKLTNLFKCGDCESEICKYCGKAQHIENACSNINKDEDLYITSKKSNIHRIYNCDPKSKSQLSRYYYHALSLYEWRMVEENRTFMLQVNPLAATDCSFQIDRVEYISNIMLLSKYEMSRSVLSQKNGQDPDEIFVYHGTSNQNIHSICRDGFRIGGVDISANHGDKYGFGIYTAGDPLVSMAYTVGSKNIIVCKALIGNCSPDSIRQDDVLRTTNYDYYETQNIDHLHPGSKYYIFFKNDYLLPIYIIYFK